MGSARKAKAKRNRDKPDKVPRINGVEVVIAVVVHPQRDADDQRQYGTYMRGPATNHSNHEMIGLLGVIAAPMVLGSARHNKQAVAVVADACKDMFAKALDSTMHGILTDQLDMGETTTVALDRNRKGS